MEEKSEKKGAPKGNLNSVTQGAYIALAKRSIDGRTTLGKHLKLLRKELTADLGDDPSTSQRILIDRVSYKVMSLHFIEQALARGEVNVSDRYIALSNSLRGDLALLGLERKTRDCIDLKAYLKTHKKEDKK